MTQISESIYVGSLVEVEGSKGLVLDFKPETNECSVALAKGGTKNVRATKLTLPKTLAGPGVGGDEESFDAFLSPSDKVGAYAEIISTCLFEKGFCVLKVSHGDEEYAAAQACMKELEDLGSLERLAGEVEDGYLGQRSPGRVARLDESPDAPTDPLLLSCDQMFSDLMSSLLPYNLDCLGKVCAERTDGLVSLSLDDSSLADYPNPLVEDKTLTDFYKLWRRSHLRCVQFLGPESATVTLASVEEASELPVPVKVCTLAAGPGTVILFRPSMYNFATLQPADTLSLHVTFSEPDQQLVLNTVGDAIQLGDMYPGPAPPSGGHPIIVNASARLGACWDSAEGYTGSQAVGCDAGVEFPITRFDWMEYYTDDAETAENWQMLVKHFSMCEGLEMFDNKYFSIPATEAISMGPMQRHLLETGAQNMAQMGITKKVADREPHHAGCSVGLDKDDWNMVPKPPECDNGCNVIAIISNRFSFAFNLKGSNYVADTACSASLAATHFARLLMADRSYDALEFFVCMGIHNCLSVLPFIGGSQNHMFSTTARCKTFNDNADGYMRGDGCSGLVLKWGNVDDNPLSIWRGSMTGQNGRSATLTAPNGLSQEDVVRKAIRDAKISPEESSIWSCHGTGTSLGDPIEVGAVRKIHKGIDSRTLIMSTNKSNVGHLEGGAAMTSLIAAVWQSKMMRANPVCHLGVFNAHIVTDDFEARWLNELATLRPEREQAHVHVSSFGFGGTNAHAVFWGRNQHDVPNLKKMYQKRLSMMAPPEVTPIGNDPRDWEHELPENILPGDVYSIPIPDEADGPMRFIKEEGGFDDGAMESDTAYSIISSCSDFIPEIMDKGDVPGLSTTYVEMPASGRLEFNFCMTVDEQRILAPATDQCKRKTERIEGPAEGLTNLWVATGVPGSDMRIDLFASQGLIAVSWLPAGGGASTTKGSVLDFLDDL